MLTNAEVFMRAAVRILIVFLCGLSSAQGPNLPSSKSDMSMTAPPKAKVETVVDNYHGHKITDPYRWLEDAKSPETRKFVEEQNAYTEQILHGVPGREKLRARSEQLLAIGRWAAPRPAGNYYRY